MSTKTQKFRQTNKITWGKSWMLLIAGKTVQLQRIVYFFNKFWCQQCCKNSSKELGWFAPIIARQCHGKCTISQQIRALFFKQFAHIGCDLTKFRLGAPSCTLNKSIDQIWTKLCFSFLGKGLSTEIPFRMPYVLWANYQKVSCICWTRQRQTFEMLTFNVYFAFKFGSFLLIETNHRNRGILAGNVAVRYLTTLVCACHHIGALCSKYVGHLKVIKGVPRTWRKAEPPGKFTF